MHQHFAARTPVCDHAMTVLYWADRDKAAQLLRTPGIGIVRSKHRIKALQFLGPDPAGLTSGSHHKRPAGSPHRNERYDNVKGMWHIDRIPDEWRELFFIAFQRT